MGEGDTRGRGLRISLMALSAVALFSACAQQSDSGSCAQAPSQVVAGSTGSADVFVPDPRIASGNPGLTPFDDLDGYRTKVTLEHLTGLGVLQGQYVDVRTNAGSCPGGYGATSSNNQFTYSQKDSGFQEAMAYYWGDSYQSALQAAGVELPGNPVQIVAHCMKEDNAFFQVLYLSDGTRVEQVCLGDSQMTSGASYGDDAYVTVHELQHAMTTRHYSETQLLDRFPYDEAGAMNEGISDFMAMMFLSSYVPAGGQFDPAIFSSWALGHFMVTPQYRGAHRCPQYDPDFPLCRNFPAFGTDGTVSYVYPDGLGWPFSGQTDSQSAFDDFGMPEEIHNNAIIVEGALWDIYQDMLITHSGDPMPVLMKLVAKAVEDLPKPDSMNQSPVSFHEFARSLVHIAKAMRFSALDLASVEGPLQQRGLLDAPQLESGWAMQGDGFASSPGMSVIDNGGVLRSWLHRMSEDSSFVKSPAQSLGSLAPGETAVVWFDLDDISYKGLTAGGVTLTVTSLDPNVTFPSEPNPGFISSSQVQIQYSKVNGTKVVKALSNTSNLADTVNAHTIPTSSSYFQTNPHFQFSMSSGVNLATGIWVQVSPSAAHGETASFDVVAKPTNGASSTVTFNAILR